MNMNKMGKINLWIYKYEDLFIYSYKFLKHEATQDKYSLKK